MDLLFLVDRDPSLVGVFGLPQMSPLPRLSHWVPVGGRSARRHKQAPRRTASERQPPARQDFRERGVPASRPAPRAVGTFPVPRHLDCEGSGSHQLQGEVQRPGHARRGRSLDSLIRDTECPVAVAQGWPGDIPRWRGGCGSPLRWGQLPGPCRG